MQKTCNIVIVIFTSFMNSLQQLSCNTNNSIYQCWFQSSNGTIFKVAEKSEDPSALQYTGIGYSLGDCRVVVPRANVYHSGMWKCHLEFNDGSSNSTDIKVTVTNDYLYASKDVLRVAQGESLEIVTSIIPGHDSITIKYCRWVKPDGLGFATDNSQDYETKQNSTHCSLTIKHVGTEDFGIWSSVAMLDGIGGAEEGERSVSLINVIDDTQRMDYLTLIVGLGFLSIITLFMLVAMLYARKRRITIIKKASQYCKKIFAKNKSIDNNT